MRSKGTRLPFRGFEFGSRIAQDTTRELTLRIAVRIAASIRNEDAHKVILFSGTANLLGDKDHVLGSM